MMYSVSRIVEVDVGYKQSLVVCVCRVYVSGGGLITAVVVVVGVEVVVSGGNQGAGVLWLCVSVGCIGA